MAPTGHPIYQASRSGARVENLETSSTVSQRLIILEGRAGSDSTPPISSHLIAHPHPTSGFSSTKWEVNHGYFKALVQLTPGSNDIRLDYFPSESSTPIPTHFNLIYQPSSAPPLHLAILIASDSPALLNDGIININQNQNQNPQQSRGGSMFKRALAPLKSNFLDTTNRDGPIVDCPNNWRSQGFCSGGLQEVKRRFAIQAYLWQAFHSEQMRRHQLGSRAFSLDDSASDPSSNSTTSPPRRLEDLPRIHLLKSKHTLKEFRDPNNAQQFKGARNGGAMHQFAMEALRDPSVPRELHHSPVAVLVLDSKWDSQMKLLRAHAAVGSGGPGQTSIGVMGSHFLWSAPPSLETVTQAFLDEEATDTNCCVNDLNECATAWETLNIGSGAFMHEVGHALDNPHWPSGLMARGYVEFNRAFMTRSPYSSRTKSGPISPVNSSNDSKENHIHRAQAIRARWHPCFRLPSDPYLPFLKSGDPQIWREWSEATPNWSAGIDGPSVKCAAGIACIEIEINDQYRTHIEFTGLENGRSPPQELHLPSDYLASLVGFDPILPHSRRIMLRAVGCNMRQNEMKDYRAFGFLQEVQMPGFSMPVVKTMFAGQEGSRNWVVPIQDLKALEIFSGAAFDGLRFLSNSSAPSAFGPLGGGVPSSVNVRPNDTISKLVLRSGAWIDAIDIHFSSGMTSGMRGNLGGGSVTVLEPPQGYFISGVYGSSNQWVTSMGLICSRTPGSFPPSSSKSSSKSSAPAPTSRGIQGNLAPGESFVQVFGDKPVLLCPEVGGEGKDQLLTPIPSDLRTIEVFAGAAFDGFQFHSSSATSAFGSLGGSSKARIDVAGDRISKLELRAGAWIDGVNLHFSSGKNTGWQGNSHGGALKVLEAPGGYEIVGFKGTASNWVHSIGIVCRRLGN